MWRTARRDLIIAIDSLELEQRSPRREFNRRGYREFFGPEYDHHETPIELVIEFIRYFCFDAGDDSAPFNGFQDPWVVLITVCTDPRYPVYINTEGLHDQLRALVQEVRQWSEFREMLEQRLSVRN